MNSDSFHLTARSDQPSTVSEAPRKGQTITLLWQGEGDGTVVAFEVNGMLAIPEPDGVVYVRREDAIAFFGFSDGAA